MNQTSESFDSDLAALVDMCLSPVSCHSDPFTALCAVQNWIAKVQEAAEVMRVWIEESGQDPRSMGWVDDRGRP